MPHYAILWHNSQLFPYHIIITLISVYFQAWIPQELHRSVAAGAPDVSDVQDGHTEALRFRGQCSASCGLHRSVVLCSSVVTRHFVHMRLRILASLTYTRYMYAYMRYLSSANLLHCICSWLTENKTVYICQLILWEKYKVSNIRRRS